MLIALVALTACNSSYDFNFKNADEALTACRSELYDLSQIEKSEYKEVTEKINRWIALQDTTIKTVASDTSIIADKETINTYFTLADSIRSELTRIAFSKGRSIQDVIYMRINTAYNKDKITNSENYKEAVAFFEDLDRINTYKNVAETISEYKKLLSSAKNVKKEKDLMAFMKQEERCFRSYLQYQKDISLTDAETISSATEEFYGNLQYAAEKENTALNEKLLTYLYIRLNRRVIQGAEACVKDINAKVNLRDEIREPYRWNILYPYLSIDKYSAAYLTEGQKASMMKIGKRLSHYLAVLDHANDKAEKIMEEKLAESLLRMYLKQNL